jgi:hypothetical protein
MPINDIAISIDSITLKLSDREILNGYPLISRQMNIGLLSDPMVQENHHLSK